MAFVLDSNDPSNLGMFSKAGRFTSEKHLIFQKKDEILNKQRKFLKVTSLPHLKMDFDPKNLNKQPIEEEEEKPRVTPISKTRPHIEPFSVQQSREDFYEGKKVKHPPPPCGFYNPKFHYVEKTPRTLFKYGKEKARPKTAQVALTVSQFNFSLKTEQDTPKMIPERPKLKVVSPTPLHLQKGRDDIIKSAGNNPHESRFTFFELPQNCGRTRKVHTIDMSKNKGRDYKQLYKSLEYSPDYEPNFEFGKKRLGSPGPKFEKNSSRKPFLFISTSTNENFFDTSHTEYLKYSRPRTVDFNKYPPREYDPSSPLPSFMQKCVNSRHALGSIRQKTLEINNYMDGKFQTVTSSFSPSKPSTKGIF